MSEEKKQRWFPLESNPDLINKYIKDLGWDSLLFEFKDIFSTEDWALDMIPQPVLAVVMLYPLTENQEKHYAEASLAQDSLDDVWFIKQRIGNACGTIGLLHSLLNVPEGMRAFQPDSWLAKFQSDCPTSLDPVRKAELLEGDEKIANLHDQATSSETNATSRGSLDDKLITHFVALVAVNGVLYELDGRKPAPVSHGPTSNLLKDACRVARTYMEQDPEEMRFTILALAPKQYDD